MPYYRITIWQTNKKPISGIRFSNINSPEVALTHFWELTKSRMSRHGIERFEVVMLPKTSREVKEFIQQQQQKTRK